MSNTENTPPDDDTTPSKWDQVEALQNFLAKMVRQHDAGKDIDLVKLFAEVKRLTGEAEEKTAKEAEQTDIASGQIDYWAHVAKRKDTVSTGLGKLNGFLGGGLEPQRLIVLLGAPGGGKTTLANQIAVHAANSKRPVLYVTSEDVPFNLLAKSLARLGQINYTAVLKGYPDQKQEIEQALAEYKLSLASDRLHYFDATMKIDMDTIRECARAHFEAHKDGGTGILVVDYLQRLARAQSAYRSGNQDLRQAVTVLTEQLRQIASELDCCVLCLASQNRASGYGASSNSLSSAKESGDIEYTADVMMSIGDDEQRLSTVSWLQSKMLKIDKNRQGVTGILKLDWYPDRQTFTEAPEDEPYTPPAADSKSNGRGRRSKS